MFIIPQNTKVTVLTLNDLDPKGVCIRIKFPNNQVISIIKHKYSYGGDQGLWEYMIVPAPSGRGECQKYVELGYNSEPVGHQTDEDIQKVLEELANDYLR